MIGKTVVKKLRTEYKLLEKPKFRELVLLTAQIMSFAITSALLLWAADKGFNFILSLLLSL